MLRFFLIPPMLLPSSRSCLDSFPRGGSEQETNAALGKLSGIQCGAGHLKFGRPKAHAAVRWHPVLALPTRVMQCAFMSVEELMIVECRF